MNKVAATASGVTDSANITTNVSTVTVQDTNVSDHLHSAYDLVPSSNGDFDGLVSNSTVAVGNDEVSVSESPVAGEEGNAHLATSSISSSLVVPSDMAYFLRPIRVAASSSATARVKSTTGSQNQLNYCDYFVPL